MTVAPAITDADALDVIEEEARAVVQFFGIVQCDMAAQMLVGRVVTRLGGRRVYVATTRISKAEQHAQIRAKFDGRNVAELAVAHRMSERQVRRIVHKKSSLEK